MALQMKRQAPSILADIEGDKRFFCRDGMVIKNLKELSEYFNYVTRDVFHYHVNSEKNDFSNWIRDVLGDRKLASEINQVQSPLEASQILMDKLARLRNNRSPARRATKKA